MRLVKVSQFQFRFYFSFLFLFFISESNSLKFSSSSELYPASASLKVAQSVLKVVNVNKGVGGEGGSVTFRDSYDEKIKRKPKVLNFQDEDSIVGTGGEEIITGRPIGNQQFYQNQNQNQNQQQQQVFSEINPNYYQQQQQHPLPPPPSSPGLRETLFQESSHPQHQHQNQNYVIPPLQAQNSQFHPSQTQPGHFQNTGQFQNQHQQNSHPSFVGDEQQNINNYIYPSNQLKEQLKEQLQEQYLLQQQQQQYINSLQQQIQVGNNQNQLNGNTNINTNTNLNGQIPINSNSNINTNNVNNNGVTSSLLPIAGSLVSNFGAGILDDLNALRKLLNFQTVEGMLQKVNSFDSLKCIPRLMCQMVAKRQETSKTAKTTTTKRPKRRRSYERVPLIYPEDSRYKRSASDSDSSSDPEPEKDKRTLSSGLKTQFGTAFGQFMNFLDLIKVKDWSLYPYLQGFYYGGQVKRQDECSTKFSTCPFSDDQLVYYFNNYNGGFFQSFRSLPGYFFNNNNGNNNLNVTSRLYLDRKI